MSKTRVRDARPLPAVCLSRADLAVLGERVEPRRLPAVRSTLLALLELAGEPEGWTKNQLAQRAGVGTGLLRDCLGVLERTGLVRCLEDGSLMLSAPSGQEALPMVPEQQPARVAPPRVDELEQRARGFMAWHAGRIAQQTGKPPAGTPAALAAGKQILRHEADGSKIRARIEWALTDRFYADKVVTLQSLARWWQKICLAFDAAQAREPQERSASFQSVSYDGDRVQVA